MATRPLGVQCVVTLQKARVQGYWRTTPSGQRVWVEGYDSRRASSSQDAPTNSGWPGKTPQERGVLDTSPPPPSHAQKERWEGMTRRELVETHQDHMRQAQNLDLPTMQRAFWRGQAVSLAQYMKERWPHREAPETPETPSTGTRTIVTDTATAERMTQTQQARARAERQRVARGHTDAELTARIQDLEAQGHHHDMNRQRLTEPQRVWLSLVQEQQRRGGSETTSDAEPPAETPPAPPARARRARPATTQHTSYATMTTPDLEAARDAMTEALNQPLRPGIAEVLAAQIADMTEHLQRRQTAE